MTQQSNTFNSLPSPICALTSRSCDGRCAAAGITQSLITRHDFCPEMKDALSFKALLKTTNLMNLSGIYKVIKE